MKLEPYLYFDGRCEEALEFYKRALGAEVTMLARFKDAPPPPPGCQTPPGEKIMHATLRVGSTFFMASDGNATGKMNFDGFGLSLGCDSIADTDRCWNALLDGGTVIAPIGPTFFSPRFGMLRDRFGITWLLMAPR